MRIVWTPATSPDDPEEFGFEYAWSTTNGTVVRHMERREVEALLQSAETALRMSDDEKDPDMRKHRHPIAESTMCL